MIFEGKRERERRVSIVSVGLYIFWIMTWNLPAEKEESILFYATVIQEYKQTHIFFCLNVFRILQIRLFIQQHKLQPT